MMHGLGKMLMILGAAIFLAGIILTAATKMGITFGSLPGDVTYHRKNITVFAPFGTMIIVSLVLTLIMNVISKWK